MSTRLIEELVRRGRLMPDQVRRVEQVQAERGGTLDTALLELGVDETTLLAAMANSFGLSIASPAAIRAPADVPALRAFPEQWARRYSLAPLALDRDRGELSLLVTIPSDGTLLSRLAAMLELRLVPLLTTELRVHERLALLYGSRMPERLVVLLESTRRPASVASLPPMPPPGSEPPPPDTGLREAMARLREAGGRDEIIQQVLERARSDFDFTAFFKVSEHQTTGWSALGTGSERITQVVLPKDARSAFATAIRTQAHFLGPLPMEDLRALSPVGRPPPRAALIIPIRVRDRAVALLYAEHGPSGVSPRAASDLMLFTNAVGLALEGLVKRRKSSTIGPASEVRRAPASAETDDSAWAREVSAALDREPAAWALATGLASALEPPARARAPLTDSTRPSTRPRPATTASGRPLEVSSARPPASPPVTEAALATDVPAPLLTPPEAQLAEAPAAARALDAEVTDGTPAVSEGAPQALAAATEVGAQPALEPLPEPLPEPVQTAVARTEPGAPPVTLAPPVEAELTTPSAPPVRRSRFDAAIDAALAALDDDQDPLAAAAAAEAELSRASASTPADPPPPGAVEIVAAPELDALPPLPESPPEVVALHTAPVDAAHVDAAHDLHAAPVDAAHVDAAHAADVVLDDTLPLDAAPIDAAPSEAAPVDAAPIDAAHATDVALDDTLPLDAAPVDAAAPDTSNAPESLVPQGLPAIGDDRTDYADTPTYDTPAFVDVGLDDEPEAVVARAPRLEAPPIPELRAPESTPSTPSGPAGGPRMGGTAADDYRWDTTTSTPELALLRDTTIEPAPPVEDDLDVAIDVETTPLPEAVVAEPTPLDSGDDVDVELTPAPPAVVRARAETPIARPMPRSRPSLAADLAGPVGLAEADEVAVTPPPTAWSAPPPPWAVKSSLPPHVAATPSSTADEDTDKIRKRGPSVVAKNEDEDTDRIRQRRPSQVGHEAARAQVGEDAVLALAPTEAQRLDALPVPPLASEPPRPALSDAADEPLPRRKPLPRTATRRPFTPAPDDNRPAWESHVSAVWNEWSQAPGTSARSTPVPDQTSPTIPPPPPSAPDQAPARQLTPLPSAEALDELSEGLSAPIPLEAPLELRRETWVRTSSRIGRDAQRDHDDAEHALSADLPVARGEPAPVDYSHVVTVSGRIERSVSGSDLMPVESTALVDRPPSSTGGVDYSLLLDRLEDPSAEVRGQAHAELLLHAEAALPQIMRRFPGRLVVDPFSATTTLPAFGGCSALTGLLAAIGPAAHAWISERLDDPLPAVRLMAVHYYGSARVPEILPRLTRRLHDEEPQVAALTVATLAYYRDQPGYTQVLSHLHARLSSPSPNARRHAVRLLGALRDGTAVPLLAAVFDRRDKALLDVTEQALAEITRQRLGPTAKKWLAWWESHRRLPRVEWLLEALDAADPELRRAAADELRALSGVDPGYQESGAKRARDDAKRRWAEWWAAHR